jgi:hypothetical protein
MKKVVSKVWLSSRPMSRDPVFLYYKWDAGSSLPAPPTGGFGKGRPGMTTLIIVDF